MQYDKLADNDVVQVTSTALINLGYNVKILKTGESALAEISLLIPKGASIMNSSSTTLQQIGFIDLLKSGKHDWQDLHSIVTAETNDLKRNELRKQSLCSDYYLGSVHALTETGQMVIASNTGSQLPHLAFSSKNLILVVSTKKIVNTLESAMNRIEKYVLPLENKRMQALYKVNTTANKILIFNGESALIGRKITILLVAKDLGF